MYWSEGWTYHAGFHRAYRLVLGVVRDVGRAVEQLMDTVSAISADDGATSCTCDGFSDRIVRIPKEGVALGVRT